MAKEIIAEHEIIGALEWNRWRIGKDYFCDRTMQFMGDSYEIEIIVRVDQGEAITEKQVEKYQQVMANSDNLLNTAIQAVLALYIHEYDVGIDAEEYPPVSTLEELKPLVSEPTIYILKDWQEGIGFAFGCDWEEEHGLGVRIVEDKVVEIGLQDILL